MERPGNQSNWRGACCVERPVAAMYRSLGCPAGILWLSGCHPAMALLLSWWNLLESTDFGPDPSGPKCRDGDFHWGWDVREA